MSRQTYCRYAPSLGDLEGTPKEVWGTEVYNRKKHRNEPTVFFGLYDMRDYVSLWNHRGKRWVLWCGSDITNLKNNFLLNDGKLKRISKIFSGFPRMLDRWLAHNVENWVENEAEKLALLGLGIKSRICPSFMGNKHSYEISYEWRKDPQVYVSASNGRQKEYGWETVENIADRLPMITFHLYGANWITHKKNVIIHGRISKEQMNEEVKKMQCGLRLNDFDGASEVIVKSALWGQYPIGKLHHPFIEKYNTEDDLINLLNMLKYHKEPNYKAHNWCIENLNNYPWFIEKEQFLGIKEKNFQKK